MWNKMDWDDTCKLKDHYFYLVTHVKYRTPMKAKWHDDLGGSWQILGGSGADYDYVFSWSPPFVTAWMELPECYGGSQ